MRTQRTPLLQTYFKSCRHNSSGQKPGGHPFDRHVTSSRPASLSSSVLAGLLAVGFGLPLPLAQATETEINSLSEERQIMPTDLPRPDSKPTTPAVSGSPVAAPKKAVTESAPAAPAGPDTSPLAQPAETNPADTTPTVTKPAESKPSDSKASGSKASGNRPTATKPAEKQAAESRAAVTADAVPAKPAAPVKATNADDAAVRPAGEAELPKAKSVDLAKPISDEELQTPPVSLPPTTTEDTAASAKPAPSPSEGAAGSPVPEAKLPAPEVKLPALDAADKADAQTDDTDRQPASPADTQPPGTSTAEAQTSDAETSDAQTAGSPDADASAADEAAQTGEAPAETPPAAPDPVKPKSLFLLGTEVPPSTATRLAWTPSQSFDGLSMPTPVLVVNGAKDGPTVCLTAAIHGDELNGIEVVRRVLYGLNPKELTGAVIGVPIVNLQGFRRGSRYLSDRRDLNRYFPGNPDGSAGARIAYSFFNSVIRHCNVLVDLHTGSFDRINLPQVRADLRDPESARLTHYFGATVVLHGAGAEGTLRRAAVEYGIPAVTLEAGGPLRLEEANVTHGVAAVRTLLNSMGMIKKFSFWGKPEPVYYQSTWVRVNHGGILFSNVDLGQKVKAGDVLGTVTDPITNVRHPILSTHDGRVIGMALNQVMLPGYAAYHIGIAAKDEVNAVPTDESLLLNDVDLSLSDEDLSELTARALTAD